MKKIDLSYIAKQLEVPHVKCLLCDKKTDISMFDEQIDKPLGYKMYYFDCCTTNILCIYDDINNGSWQDIKNPDGGQDFCDYTYYKNINCSDLYHNYKLLGSIEGYVCYNKFKKMQNFK